ncbi:carbohydrate binding domain-containing protein [Microbacterium arborescens]|uniref:carbohydrate binding domain-containing protein n=1 Tax=Microbacterium arborescens TaxID=33883 RepID=UPI000DF7227B|nr:carbohydrate binding domain-containing protein [Microbacterium arborescens]
MPVRASDRITLTVLPAPTYVRTYYLLQSSTLAAPAAPSTNPPSAPWTTAEPGYVEGETNTLYTVQLVAYGSAAFEFGEVQKSSAYEAAKQAYNLSLQARDAATTADGRLTVSAAAPVAADGTGKPVGAVWFRRDGTNRFIGAWEWMGTAAGWVARTIENAMIATLDAGKINTGFLDVANRVRANAISVRQMLVGSLTNLLEDASFDVDTPTSAPLTTAWTSIHANVSRVTTGARSGTGVLRMKASTAAYDGIRQKNAIHVEPGEEYRFSAWVRRESAAAVTGAIELSVAYGATEAATTTVAAVAASPAGLGTTYVQVTGIWTVPDGVFYVRPRLVMRADTGNTNTYLVDDLAFQLRMGGELIVDGEITAPKLNIEEIWGNEAWLNVMRVGVVEVDMLAPGVGDSITAEVRGSFNIIAGQTAALQEGVASVQDQVIDAQAGAQAATAAAALAQAGVDATAADLEAAQAAQAATQAQLDQVAMNYRFSADGLIMGRPDSPTQLLLRNTGASIRVNGVDVSTWDEGQMRVSSLVAVKVVLGNHQLEKFGARTVMRAL